MRSSRPGSRQISSDHAHPVVALPQDIMKVEMRKDLKGATWAKKPPPFGRALSAKTRECPIQIGEVDNFQHYKVHLDDWKDVWENREIIRTFPLISSGSNSSERSHYEGLAKYLNDGLSWCKKALGKRVKSYNKDLRFVVCDKQTTDGAPSSAPVQPDLAGAAGLPKHSSTLSWHPKSGARQETIEIPVEVKDKWPDLVAQAATYARCLRHAEPYRLFALVIGYVHTKKELRFLCFHSGGLTASEALQIDSLTSRRGMIQLLLALLTWDDRADAGLPLSVDDKYIYLQQDGNDKRGQEMKVKSVLHRRIGVRGRSPQVLLLEQQAPASVPQDTAVSEHEATPQSQDPRTEISGQTLRRSSRPKKSTNQPGKFCSYRIVSKIDLVYSGSQSLRSKPPGTSAKQPNPNRHSDSRIEFVKHSIIALSKPVTRETRELVAKFVFARHENASIESNMLQECSNQFGLPESYYSCLFHLKDNLPANNHLICKDGVFWPMFGLDTAAGSKLLPDLRSCVMSLTGFAGKSLVLADSPKTLFWAIIHAMIGYRNLLESGYQHRDISIGNVLWSQQAVQVKSVFETLKKKTEEDLRVLLEKHGVNNQCNGLVIDGDMAIKLAAGFLDGHRGTRSGTSEFMSVDMLRASEMGHEYIQSSIDDIWSFFWVAQWAAVCNEEDFPPSKTIPSEVRYLRYLVSGSHAERDSAYLVITRIRPAQEPIYGTFLSKSKPIFKQWFEKLEELNELNGQAQIQECCGDIGLTRALFEKTTNQAITDLVTIVTNCGL